MFADIDPVTLNLDPQAAAAAVTERTSALLPVHIFGYPADLPAFEGLAGAHGLAIVEDACEALGARHRDGVARRRARQPGGLRLLRQQAADDRRGRDGHARPTPTLKERIDSERNQGRAADMGWLDHDRLGFNYRLSELACAMGVAQLGASTTMLAERARVAGLYRQALAGLDGLSCPAPTTAATSAAGSCSSSSCPHGVDRDAMIARARARAASRASPTCRRST